MRVDPTIFTGLQGQDVLDSKIYSVTEEADRNDDPVYLSDLMIYMAAGPAEPLLKVLREDPNEVYILHCVRDEWGNIPQPGDIVEYRGKKDLIRNGKPVTSQQELLWKTNGEYEKRMFNVKKFIVDSKGCIKCNGHDAQFFIREFGIHSASGNRISQHAMEHSEDVAKCPDGSLKHVWYYRFKECDKTIYPYENLETPVKPEGPKRGASK